MCIMVDICKDMGVQYTGENITNHFGRPYLLKFSDELNILANVTGNRLGIRYTTHLINYHRHHEGFNALCKSTVNISFLRIQHKRTKKKNIQQGTKN